MTFQPPPLHHHDTLRPFSLRFLQFWSKVRRRLISLLRFCRCAWISASCSVSPANRPPGTLNGTGGSDDIMESTHKWHQAADPGLAAASGLLLSIWFFCGLPSRSDAPASVLFSVSLQSGLGTAVSVHWIDLNTLFNITTGRCRVTIDRWDFKVRHVHRNGCYFTDRQNWRLQMSFNQRKICFLLHVSVFTAETPNSVIMTFFKQPELNLTQFTSVGGLSCSATEIGTPSSYTVFNI